MSLAFDYTLKRLIIAIIAGAAIDGELDGAEVVQIVRQDVAICFGNNLRVIAERATTEGAQV